METYLFHSLLFASIWGCFTLDTKAYKKIVKDRFRNFWILSSFYRHPFWKNNFGDADVIEKDLLKMKVKCEHFTN